MKTDYIHLPLQTSSLSMQKKSSSLNFNSPMFIRTVFIISFLLLHTQIFAHGDLSLRIEKKTEEIKQNPKDCNLYFQRGLLYQQHSEYKKSLTDYRKSQQLGNQENVLQYRIAEVNYLSEEYKVALKHIAFYLKKENTNSIGKKLEAQILFHLKKYKKAIKSYRFVIKNLPEIRPEEILEYANIILTENNKNYKEALSAIETGLDKLGKNTLSLQLKKLEYLKESHQTEKVIKQYNYFISEYKRNEFWYYKKAKYLANVNQPQQANIALQLAHMNIAELDIKFKNMKSIIKLKEQIKTLENTINN